MEKLIDLLTEYAHTYADHYDDTGEEIVITFTGHFDQCFYYHYHENGIEHFETLVDDVIISKRYGFIAWLIENKHIKPYKAYKDFIDGNYVQFDGGESIPSVNGMLYDSILCGLAISDNPIELLCDIIK